MKASAASTDIQNMLAALFEVSYYDVTGLGDV